MKAIVIAPGRTGTRTLTRMIRQLALRNGVQWDVRHQGEDPALYQALDRWLQSGDGSFLRDVWSTWDHDVQVAGNHLCFCIPLIREHFGPDITVLRLQRDPTTHLQSVLTGVRASRNGWIAFEPGSRKLGPGDWNLPTGPTLGSCDPAAWEAMALEERVAHYIRAMVERIDRDLPAQYPDHHTFHTEQLSTSETRHRLAQALSAGWSSNIAPVHENRRAMVDFESLSFEQAAVARAMWASFDFELAAKRPVYLLDHSLSLLTELLGGGSDAKRQLLQLLAGRAEAIATGRHPSSTSELSDRERSRE